MLQTIGNTSVNSTLFAPNERKVVVIDGKTYPVTRVQDNNTLFNSFAPTYKEVVIVNGQQYDVQTTKDWIASDKTKQVITIDGKQYDVGNGSQAMLKSGIQNITNSIFSA